MKTSIILTLAILIGLNAVPTFAEDSSYQERSKAFDEKYQAWKEKLKTLPEEEQDRLRTYDNDYDGIVSEEEIKRHEDYEAKHQARMKELLEKYDTDKDGKFSDEENKNMTAAIAEERKKKNEEADKAMIEYKGTMQEILAKVKTDTQAALEARKKEAIEKFDADGDGVLNETEKAAAHEYYKDKPLFGKKAAQ